MEEGGHWGYVFDGSCPSLSRSGSWPPLEEESPPAYTLTTMMSVQVHGTKQTWIWSPWWKDNIATSCLNYIFWKIVHFSVCHAVQWTKWGWLGEKSKLQQMHPEEVSCWLMNSSNWARAKTILGSLWRLNPVKSTRRCSSHSFWNCHSHVPNHYNDLYSAALQVDSTIISMLQMKSLELQ